jgi:hypothetical protein
MTITIPAEKFDLVADRKQDRREAIIFVAIAFAVVALLVLLPEGSPNLLGTAADIVGP